MDYALIERLKGLTLEQQNGLLMILDFGLVWIMVVTES